MILKSNKAFRAKSFTRKANDEIVNQLLLDLTGESIDSEDFQDDFSKRYDSFPDDLKKDFELINYIACDRAMPLMVNYATKMGIVHQELSIMELAITLFRKDKKAFFELLQWFEIDSIDTFRDFKGSQEAEPNHQNIEDFKNELCHFFKEKSRGNNINIDIYNQPNKIAYIIEYGDFLKRVNIFDENENFKSIKQRQAKAITLLYYPKLAKLRIKCSDFEILNKARDSFAQFILEKEDFFKDPKETEFFDLNKLVSMQEDEFTTHPAYGIREVKLTNIEAYPSSDKKGKIVIKHPEKLREIEQDKNLNLEQLNIIKVNIKFKFMKGFGRPRTIYLKAPNISNFNDSSRDEILRECFKDWEVLND